MASSNSLPTADPLFRRLAILSETERTSTPSSTVRSTDERLGQFFLKDREGTFSDADLEQISFLLQNSGRHSYSLVPRIYSVLRIIDRLEVLDEFIKSNITDLSFPFSVTSFPSTIGVEIQTEFLRSQSLVLTKTLDLEKGERGGHLYFGKGEPIPYEVKGRLGTGGYGEVEKVISLLSHQEFARKKVRRVRNSKVTQRQIKDFLAELRILKRISHIHCVKMIGSYTDPKYFALLMSPVADCNLATYMTEAVDSKDKQSLLRTFFGCLSNGLQYLHDSKIRHRDVKPENILVKGAKVLWTDFGISFDWEELSRSTTTMDSAKSPVYCAPEVANCEPRNSSSDIWSLGCVFLEMTTILKGHTITQMRQRFRENSENYRFYANLTPATNWIESLHKVGSEQDNEPLKWVKAMLNVNPRYRPTADTLYGMITDEYTVTTTAVTPRTFCGSCCVEDDELASESDGEAWVEEPDEGSGQNPSGDSADNPLLDATSDNTPKADPLANDFETLMTKLLPVDPDLETAAQTYQTWHIQNWRKLPRRVNLPVFECGGSPWRILFYPSGNEVDNVSLYLDCGHEDGQVPENWYACVQFALVLWSPSQPSKFFSHVAHHRFNAPERDWGFTRFCDLKKLFLQPWDGHESPLVQNEEANITAYVRIVKDPTGVLWHNFQDYDSKKETGMVGLKKQGATDYLNIFLQSSYFINALRKAVYQIPTKKDARTDLAWALQRLFYSLQTSNTPVSTRELTKSFGWSSKQLFEPQDVQEMSRNLMERLEQRMKGTPVENALPDLFTGKVKTYISCINVDYKISRTEKFWDIQLNVANNRSLDDGFKDYIKVENMDRELQYYTGEQYKLQDARKGVVFEMFPPVLHLHLKRYEYDNNIGTIVKLHDYFEFPEEFDATPYLSARADKSEPWIYLLVGVVVHDGDINSGYYYAFLRPTKHGPFYKFCDDRVTRATLKEAINENFGRKYANLHSGLDARLPYSERLPDKKSSAYMLVYIRKSRLDLVLADITKKDLPEHLEQMAEAVFSVV